MSKDAWINALLASIPIWIVIFAIIYYFWR